MAKQGDAPGDYQGRCYKYLQELYRQKATEQAKKADELIAQDAYKLEWQFQGRTFFWSLTATVFLDK